MISTSLSPLEGCHALRFAPLHGHGRAYEFPCDPNGQVQFDRLNDRQRACYLYARVVVGRELAWPVVERRAG